MSRKTDIDLEFLRLHQQEIINELLPVVRGSRWGFVVGISCIAVGVLVALISWPLQSPAVFIGLALMVSGFMGTHQQLHTLRSGIRQARRRSFIAVARLAQYSDISSRPTPETWREVASGDWAFTGATTVVCNDLSWEPDPQELDRLVRLLDSFLRSRFAEEPPDAPGLRDMFLQSFEANVYTPPCLLPASLVGREDLYLICSALIRVYLPHGFLPPAQPFPVLVIPMPSDVEWTAINIPWWHWNAEARATVQPVVRPPGMNDEPLGHVALRPGRRGRNTWPPHDPLIGARRS